MSIKPIYDIKEYERQKNAIRAQFRAERTGDQVRFEEQSKLLKPVIDVQKETAKAITEKIASKDDVLIPFTKELQRRHDQLETLTQQPFYNQDIPDPTHDASGSKESIHVNLDRNLTDEDIENLEDMRLDLPSKVFEKGEVRETLEKIKTFNRSIGQILGIGPAGKKATTAEKVIAESRKKTLVKYIEKIEGMIKSSQFISTPKKGKGLNFYKSPEDLWEKVSLLINAKISGNNNDDHDDDIIDGLLELLRIDAISKDTYDQLNNMINNKINNKKRKAECKACKCVVRYDDKAKHKRTKKHKNNLHN